MFVTAILKSRPTKHFILGFLLIIGFIVVVRIIHLSRYDLKNDSSHFITISPPVSNLLPRETEVRLLIYNRIPKTGGTSLVHLVYHLCELNRVAITMVNISGNRIYLNRFNQLQLVRNMSARSYARPLLLHGHFVFLNFAQLGSPLRPIYINMIRDPLERLVSHYYFLRFGDDFRPNVIRKRMKVSGRQQTFDDCVKNGGLDCHSKNLWVQVPFFCGHAAYCSVPGNPEALETAKRRVTEDYFLVGITEDFDEFVALLEKLLPRFFSGAQALLQSVGGWHLRRTKHKLPINDSTRAIFRDDPIWQAEQSFYEYVRSEFWAIRQTLLRGPRLNFQLPSSLQLNQWIHQQFLFQRTRPEMPN